MDELSITDMPERSRFEATVDGKLVGVLEYRRKDDVIFYDHAETEIPFRGKGIAGRIVEAALIAARAEGLRIVPRCPYVVDWVAAHPEFQPLVAS